MIRKDIEKTKLFSEFDYENQKKYFDVTAHKYLPNIDTFYYSAFLNNDSEKNNDENLLSLISKLVFFKDIVINEKSDKYWFEDIELKITRKRFSIYNYCLSIENMFDIFISDYLPNENTPRFVIQLRSVGLWLDGTDKLIYKSFDVLRRVLSEFNLNISKTQENRIDYCYHTNNIQNLYKFMNDNLLTNNCNTTFDTYSKVGRKHKKSLTVEYVSFGNRKSNNLFVRIYNKTREVIELGYKSFFIDYWYNSRLISLYDKYVYEYAYKVNSYNSLEWGKIDFYLKFGSDYNLKNDLELLKQDYSTNLDFVRKFISDKLPQVTLITNIEYQTMRKYYRSSDKLIDTFKHTSKVIELDRLFRIIDNRKIFLDYLTSTCLCFVKTDYKKFEDEKIYLEWWRRLRAVKLKCITATEYTREYSKKLDYEKLQARFKGTIATMSLYIDCEANTEFNDDISSVICSLNDNDFERHKLQITQQDTGEILSFDDDNSYNRMKENKKKSLKSLLKAPETSKNKFN